jgi:hypothetical protein
MAIEYTSSHYHPTVVALLGLISMVGGFRRGCRAVVPQPHLRADYQGVSCITGYSPIISTIVI